MKKPVYAFADDYMIERATLNAGDYSRIAIETAQALQKAQEEREAREAERATRAALPPLVTRGESLITLVSDNGVIKEVLQRQHSEDEVCFIDWVNVTCHEVSFRWGSQSVTDEQIVQDVSARCESIFGFGITEKRDRGANFYRTSYTLGDKYGLVCYGGQRDTVLIMLNGEGCTAARHGWERRLFEFLQQATQGRITRLDLSHDDITGQHFTPESLETAYDEGLFNCGGRNPDIELRGNWKNPNGKGRTLYVGNRTNGKFFRGYEKGRQLGCESSPWMRLEVEFKSVDRVIPFDALLKPSDYFAAAYPLLSAFSDSSQRILTTQATVTHTYESMQAWLKHQAGSALNLMFQIEGDAKKVLDMVMREGKTPRGLQVPDWRFTKGFIHDTPVMPPLDMAFITESFARE